MCDDDSVLADLLQMVLEGEGYAVKTANDGVEALELNASNQPDLIILDLDMPRKNGFEVLETLAKDKLRKGSLIVIVSAVEKPTEIARAKKLGASSFLIKPFDTSKLIKEVHRMLDPAKVAQA